MNEFNDALFKTKIDNVFVKLYSAIIVKDLSSVKHFISDDMFNKYQTYIDELNKKHEIQMYDELNVKSSTVINSYEDDDSYIVEVELVSRYMDYVMDEDSLEVIRGNNQRRIELTNILTFKKKKVTKEYSLTNKCPNCGANISVNSNGTCSYCGGVFNLEEYDYILVDIKTL